VAAVASGLLLWVAFPPQAQADSAWLALVPLLLVVRSCAPRAAFGWAWLAGLVFWTLTLSWFPAIIKNGGPWALVVLGQVALAAWCALFLAVFASVSGRVWRWAGAGPGWRRLLAVLAIDPLVWVGTEYLRGWLFSGFAWNFLGVSQVGVPSLIQVASVGGVYAVSALVVLSNGAVTSIAERTVAPLVARFSGLPAVRPERWCARVLQSAESLLPFAVLMACWAWGAMRVHAWLRAERDAEPWRVALVQPNSPCVFEIDSDATRAELRGRLLDQTRLAGAARPDLTVWPETAVLGWVPHEAETMRVVREGAAAAGGPLLTGALEIERVEPGPAAPRGLRFYNAAWLFSSAGEAMGRYRKQHLVPFGEYIPLDKTIPLLQRLAPTGVSCTAGGGPCVLTITKGPGRELGLGPLICFEDTVPALSRSAVRAGARLLVLMTNDAWFNGSIEPLQHLNQSVFRAVENGVPLVRAANSGVSCVVDPVGRVTRLESGGDVADFTGFLVAPMTVPERPLPSPYTRCGDWLLAIPGALLAAGLALGGLLADARMRRSRARSRAG
jgi:apolipoprotein N-acyltransferase